MDRRGQLWTAQEDGCLKSLKAIGLPEDEIAASLGRNEDDVLGRMRVLGLAGRTRPLRRAHTPARRTLALRDREGKAHP